MSEENALNVEDDLTPPPVPDAPTEPAPVEAAPPPESEDIDLNAVDFKDEARIKGLIGELSRKRAENRSLKQQAERSSQLEAELNQVKPQLEFVKANPQLFQARPAEPEKPPAPEADPDAVEAARLMDFYKTDGSPDVDRGARWLALQDRRSGRVAQQTLQPYQQQSTQERANSNYQLLTNFTHPGTGEKLKPEIVNHIWNATAREPRGMETLANPDSVRALALLAIGAQSLMTKAPPAPPAKEPVVTEAGGGRAGTPTQRLSSLEERVLAQRGMSAAKYEEHTKGFKPGVSNVLESD